jgi:hypothetical protein
MFNGLLDLVYSFLDLVYQHGAFARWYGQGLFLLAKHIDGEVIQLL